MKTVQVSTATPAQLDYAIACIEGGTGFVFDGITWGFTLNGQSKVLRAKGWAPAMLYSPTTKAEHGMQIAFDGRIGVLPVGDTLRWAAGVSLYDIEQQFCTDINPLVAVVRCAVREHMGATFEVPDNL